ncbi:MAG: recombination protein RecR [Candidatus Pacebacteria bacterium]|nr:recombination protein RecR [Candidatus Paceibacterota bacterium]
MFSRLTELFLKFPGIGPRQAKRFVYFLLRQSPAFTKSLIDEIEHLKKDYAQCSSCYRFFKNSGTQKICDICESSQRDSTTLLVVGNDIDFENIEKSGHFKGVYFILGNTLSVLEKEPEKKIRIKELLRNIEKRAKAELKEIVLAMSATQEGEYTADYLKEKLSPISKKYSIKISELGRGLSTGTELEYSDTDTIRNALERRIG